MNSSRWFWFSFLIVLFSDFELIIFSKEINIDSFVKDSYRKSNEDSHKLCLIVPFKNRFEELLEFVPHMHNYLNVKNIRHEIFVLNQVDTLRFNRAMLINVGFLEKDEDCDYIAMHDVDLLPLNLDLDYSYPDENPFHVASPELHPKYHYSTFIGGILLVNNNQFLQVNGMTNRFWGWGREDDELYLRFKLTNITIKRPQNITTELNTFKHVHDRLIRPRDGKSYGDQKKETNHLDRLTGLDSVNYNILNKYVLSIDKCPCNIINVELLCDYEDTPWCVAPNSLEQMKKSGRHRS